MEKAEIIAENVYGGLETPENVEIINKKENIPEELPEAVYVVVDVMYFSTTSVEIIEGGAEELIVYRGLRDKENTEATLLGGEHGKNYSPKKGYDIFNSPSFVKELDLKDHKVGLTSTNGAESVHRVEEAADGDFETIVGSTINAKAVAEYLEDNEKSIYIIACGRKGYKMIEDYLGAYLIVQHLKGEVDNDLRNVVSKELDKAVEQYYETLPDVRAKDIEEHVKKADSSRTVPKKVGSDPIKFQ